MLVPENLSDICDILGFAIHLAENGAMARNADIDMLRNVRSELPHIWHAEMEAARADAAEKQAKEAREGIILMADIATRVQKAAA